MKNRKGSSIAELYIIIAVVAIAAVVVISFSMMVGLRSSVAQARTNALSDIRVIQSICATWCDQFTELDATFSSDGNAVYADWEGDSYILSLSRNILSAVMPDGSVQTFECSEGTTLAVSLLTEGNNTLFVFTVSYHVPLGNGGTDTETFTFCRDPHAGETIPIPTTEPTTEAAP